ncbi:MAG TPA: transcriptional activator NhaR [Terriglobia bacterium]|nr:transcriptional activator NhaR [Terriglobia bacterium]
MEWLNYHHLVYFWVVARAGSVTRASAELRLAPQTVSTQVHRLEEALGEKLFVRQGRGLILTEMGRVVFRYAEEICALGRELTNTVEGRPTGRLQRLRVGVADVLPKRVAYRLIEPALKLKERFRVICREDRPDRLLAELAIQDLDVVLSDAPISPTVRVSAFNHLLGECTTSFWGKPKMAANWDGAFPRCLDGAPFLLPAEGSSLRQGLDEWFRSQGIRPDVVGEFDDFASLRVFGEAGAGFFATAAILDKEMRRESELRRVGTSDAVRMRFYAISVERKLRHPAVSAICESARHKLFA